VNEDAEPGAPRAPAGPRIRETLALLAATIVTRGELAALELDEARRRALRWMALALVAAVFGLAALATVSLLVAAVFWETHRWQSLALLLLIYAAVAAAIAAWLRNELRAAPPLLQSTLGELKRDGDALRSAWQ
jgi:uncharacterized membrane protein YqjE